MLVEELTLAAVRVLCDGRLVVENAPLFVDRSAVIWMFVLIHWL